MLRGISISSTWFTCSGTILIRRATDAPLATLKSAVSFDFLNGCRFDFLSLSPDLTSCPDRGGGHPRRHAAFCVAEGRTAPHSKFFALATRLLVNLANCDEGERRVQPRALSPANLRIDSPPSRSAFQTVPGHPEADEAGCCVDIKRDETGAELIEDNGGVTDGGARQMAFASQKEEYVTIAKIFNEEKHAAPVLSCGV